MIHTPQHHRKLTAKQKEARSAKRFATTLFLDRMREASKLWLATRDLMECW